MALGARERGELDYKKFTPARRRFFDIAMQRMRDGEVLFMPEIRAITDQARLPIAKGYARLLTTQRAQRVALHLGVAVGSEAIFGRSAFFDMQRPASELNLEEAFTHSLGPVEDLLMVSPQSWHEWVARIEQSHEEYLGVQ